MSDILDRILPILIKYAILAIIIERALYQIFDSKLWDYIENYVDEQVGGDYFDLKPWISIVVCVSAVQHLGIDMISTMFSKEKHSLTTVLTGLFVAGGSTGVYKFFKNLRKLRSAINKRKIAEAIGDIQDDEKS